MLGETDEIDSEPGGGAGIQRPHLSVGCRDRNGKEGEKNRNSGEEWLHNWQSHISQKLAHSCNPFQQTIRKDKDITPFLECLSYFARITSGELSTQRASGRATATL